ncbi:MAG TPA: hypothetical protein VK892_12455, partial [Pyrinomonadaceae bacterium]|nr:hypothetical protein [Pyrinomonadaceae bacterium]
MQFSKALQNSFSLESYGVKIGVESNEKGIFDEMLERIPRAIPNGFSPINPEEIVHQIIVKANKKSTEYKLFRNDEKIVESSIRESILDSFESWLRLTVAEFARKHIFVHAGVISWKGKAIILPGYSFHGKTTMVAELIKRGGIYFSDEYAILDEDGLVYPYPKMLSLRGIIDEYRQVDYSAESLGAVVGTSPVPVGLVFITEYKPNARWKPKQLSSGEGVMELLKHTVSVRQNP